MRSLVFVATGVALIACSQPKSDSGHSQAREQSRDSGAHMKRYYRDFDKFQLEGVGELPAPSAGAPYISVVRDDESGVIDLEVHTGWGEPLLSAPFSVKYTRRGDVYVETRVTHAADEPELQYEKKTCYIYNGTEHCYSHLYDRDPAQHDDTPLLYEYRRASPGETKSWMFEPFSEELVVREEVLFTPEIPLPSRVAKRALAIETIRYTHSERRIGAEYVYQRMKDGVPDGDPSIRHKVFSTEEFPPFFLDFVGSAMFLMERDPSLEP